MADERRLLELVQQLVSDDEQRRRLLAAPRETLITELGISRENYEALMALVPPLLAGGLFALAGAMSIDPNEIASPGWGGWGAQG